MELLEEFEAQEKLDKVDEIVKVKKGDKEVEYAINKVKNLFIMAQCQKMIKKENAMDVLHQLINMGTNYGGE